MPTAGHVVAGRYRLVRRLGEGGMGTVWVADDLTLHSQVAIKLLHSSSDEEGLRRFLREAQAAARLRSPHVVQIIEHGVDGDVPYIAMEMLDGESLATRLSRVGSLTVAQTARIVTHIARAIGKAHDAGIVHRDLKPDNVFLVRNDDEEIAKVLDFGIAKMDPLAETASKISTEAGAILGTPYYMSPEQVRGQRVDARSDLWSLAMIAFECVCGRLPFEGRAVGDVLVLICSEPLPVPSEIKSVPAAFDAWFAKAATRDVEGRFQSAKEMADALRVVAGEELPASDGATSGPQRSAVENARTLDMDSVKELGEARTVSASGTMGGASSAIHTQGGRSPWRFVLGGAALLVLGGLVVTAIPRQSSAPTVPSPISATTTEPRLPASVPIATTAPAASETASVIASSSAPPRASASAPTRVHAPATATATAKSDELTF